MVHYRKIKVFEAGTYYPIFLFKIASTKPSHKNRKRMPLQELPFTGSLNRTLPLGGKWARKNSRQTAVGGGGWVGRGVVKTEDFEGQGSGSNGRRWQRGPY